jgi:hypothetical protein
MPDTASPFPTDGTAESSKLGHYQESRLGSNSQTPNREPMDHMHKVASRRFREDHGLTAGWEAKPPSRISSPFGKLPTRHHRYNQAKAEYARLQ